MRPELIGNPRRQILHGGVISAALDVAAGLAIHLAVSKSREENASDGAFPVDRHDRPACGLSAPRARQVFHRDRPRGAARQSRGGRAHGSGERRRRTDRDGWCCLYGGVINAPASRCSAASDASGRRMTVKLGFGGGMPALRGTAYERVCRDSKSK